MAPMPFPVCVPLHLPTWTIDPEEYEPLLAKRELLYSIRHVRLGGIHPRRRALIAGSVESMMSPLCADGVYEHLLYGEGNDIFLLPACQGVPSAPWRRDPVVRIKLFGATGWKVGWVWRNTRIS